MDVKLWAVNALSGSVVGELHAVSGSLSQRFGGGTCQVTIPLAHLTKRGGSEVDWPAVSRMIGLVTGGKRTLILTAGSAVLGEWLLMERPESISDDTVTVQGIEWDGYPALRSLHASYEYTSTDQLTIARTLLTDAFQGWQETFQITVPTATSGVRRTVSWRTREGYYSDALDEIMLPDDGFDWRVEHTGTWSGEALTKVTRGVVFGSPVLSRSTSIVASHDGPGTRSGNCLSYAQDWDFGQYLHSVYAWGSGNGAKQLFYEAADNTLANAGFVKITKNLSFPDVTRSAVLKSLADAVLSAGQNLRAPAKLSLRVDRIPTLPRVGDVIAARIAPTWTMPDGFTGTMRVGEATFPIEAGRMSTVEIGAI